ncbi:hypothetical protein E3O06_01830 [Cryobacterium glaciale]|uniref:NarG-like domain-containing protein n=1 Tax=Cryobacterium glaciale TaxID=1259145 RepID=A0A4R8V3P0_9MICO|nr:respiratory nitrate reductase subunit gamma [Cryobacterium glaciale]TFB76150.1 hypothetical protein E3O06_01830 [Cryobacterium glaciale]
MTLSFASWTADAVRARIESRGGTQLSDLPFLVRLEEHPDGQGHVPTKFLVAADLPEQAGTEGAAFKTVLLDANTGQPVVPNGSMGYRYGETGQGKWNLDLEGVDPALSLLNGANGEAESIRLPCFEATSGEGSILTRGVPVRRVAGHLVTTVFDLMMAQYGVGRPGLPGDWATGYDDVSTPHTLVGMLLFTIWPFTRLVHAFTAPLHYLFRRYIVYRTRDKVPGAIRPIRRRWAPIGTEDRTRDKK